MDLKKQLERKKIRERQTHNTVERKSNSVKNYLQSN